MVEDLIRIVFRTKSEPSTTTLKGFLAAIKETDPTFSMDNTREIEILAGASLAHLFTDGNAQRAASALAMTTAAVDGARKLVVPMDLVALAESAIAQHSANNLRRPDLSGGLAIEVKGIDIGAALTRVTGEQNYPAVTAALQDLADATISSIDALAKRQAAALRDIERYLAARDEELDMLWWLTGQRSFDLDCAFESVAENARPLIFSYELGKQTRNLPGPLALDGLLSRAGLSENISHTIEEAANAVEDTWIKAALGTGEPSAVTTPIHFALKRRLETGKGDAWTAGFSAASELAISQKIRSIDLAKLFYRERLLMCFHG
jgi:hypothetical protein